MAFPLNRTAIEASFLDACHAELAALKPGNVHVHGAGHGMETTHFEAAAAAAAPFIGDAAQGVGARILGAVEASFAVTGLNTNLGIVLLAAPLAAAADAPTSGGDLRERLMRVLDTLDRTDADAAFKAIVIANPAGLGRVAASDVAEPAAVTLKEAMALASERDRIARAYITGFEDIFLKGLPALEIARRAADSETMAVTALHMSLLAAFEDSHIARKHGAEAAAAVQREARALEHLWRPAPRPESWQPLLDLDASLKARGLNPGTTADLVVGTLFADGLIRRSARKQSKA